MADGSLVVGCPRCTTPVARTETAWSCPEHGEVPPLWRPPEASYAAFGDHLRTADGFPTYLPWPLGPGWAVSDFAVVGTPESGVSASLTCTTGTSALDGPVDVVVHRAGDPGAEIGDGPPAVRVRIDSQVVPLWPVSTSRSTGEWDRSVVAGEALGRWLWIVLRPASAMLLLSDDWILKDTSRAGPHLVELPFGGPAPSW